MMLQMPHISDVDFGSLSIIQYGASPIPADLLRDCLRLFGCGFVQVYGMTEVGGTIISLGPDDHDPKGNKRMQSVGRPLPGVEVRIGPAPGLPIGAIGEIFVRADTFMTRYWKMPNETRATVDSDGWLATGDAGHLDSDGYLYLSDRIKDMVVTGGENVYPAEVEAAIYTHPAVLDVTVIGVPDKKWGEAVKALVVRRPGESVEEAELIEHTKGKIARYKVPKSVEFRDALPRNASGKVERRKLREPYWEGYERLIN
jgi:fatty-acyl-CoA synthase